MYVVRTALEDRTLREELGHEATPARRATACSRRVVRVVHEARMG